MYCRNCGSEVNAKAIACPKCGVPPLVEKKFCQECGAETKSNQMVCVKCGVKLINKGSGSLGALNINLDTSKGMPIPLLVGWIVNVLAYIIFFSVNSIFVAILMMILVAGCIYVANEHVKLGTGPALNQPRLSAKNLRLVSILDVILLVLLLIIWRWLLNIAS